MRLPKIANSGESIYTSDLSERMPPYAIPSQTWAEENRDGVIYVDTLEGSGRHKPGYGIWIERKEVC